MIKARRPQADGPLHPPQDSRARCARPWRPGAAPRCPPLSPHTPQPPLRPRPPAAGGRCARRGGAAGRLPPTVAAVAGGRCLARRCQQPRGRPRRGPPAPQPARRLPPEARSRFGAGSDGDGAGGNRPTLPPSRHFALCLCFFLGNSKWGLSPPPPLPATCFVV